MILTAVAAAQAAGARLEAACSIVGVSARTLERWRKKPGGDGRYGPRRRPSNALTPAEEARVMSVLQQPEYRGLSPKQVVPRLADEGEYVASESTIYRLQRRCGLRENRPAQPRRQAVRTVELHRATGPNQVWSWDITYLPTIVRGRFLYLYLVLDVWSRRIVGWQVRSQETSEYAAELICRICDDEGIDPKGLILHADNGGPMRGSTMLATLQWLGIVPSFSRPHVSDDNPYSESLFRTLKHTPAYPRRPFESQEGAAEWVSTFVAWYNGQHRHSAIRYVTPAERHFGQDQDVLSRRAALYEAARRRTPERWTGSTRDWSPIPVVVLHPEPQATSGSPPPNADFHMEAGPNQPS